MNIQAIFWAIVSLLYLALLIMRIIWMKSRYKQSVFKGAIAKINSIPLGIKEFHDDVNLFVAEFNKLNRRNNIIQIIGYSAAFTAALMSFFASMVWK